MALHRLRDRRIVTTRRAASTSTASRTRHRNRLIPRFLGAPRGDLICSRLRRGRQPRMYELARARPDANGPSAQPRLAAAHVVNNDEHRLLKASPGRSAKPRPSPSVHCIAAHPANPRSRPRRPAMRRRATPAPIGRAGSTAIVMACRSAPRWLSLARRPTPIWATTLRRQWRC
jgi:hypothetical protein